MQWVPTFAIDVIRSMTWCFCEADTKPLVSFPLYNTSTKSNSNNISLSFISLLITVLDGISDTPKNSTPISLFNQLSISFVVIIGTNVPYFLSLYPFSLFQNNYYNIN